MSKYLKLFETTSQYEAYMGGGEKILPNVSLIEETNKVEYNPYSDPDAKFVICTYNVTSTSSATTLLGSSATGITKQIIDGVEQSEVVKNYIFDTTGEHLVKYEFSNNEIGAYAFTSCTKLTNITIPDSVTSIGKDAFAYCSKLTSITIPNTVTTIDGGAFNNCTNLTSVTIPNSVTSIGKDAFFSCSRLSSVTVESTTPPSLGNGVFNTNADSRKIYVPAESVAAYKSASGWNAYANDIEAIA